MVVRKDYRARVVKREKPPRPPKRPRTKEEWRELRAHAAHGIVVALATFCFVLLAFWGANLARTWIESAIKGKFMFGIQRTEQQIASSTAPQTSGTTGQAPPQPAAASSTAPSSVQPYFQILPPGAVNGTEQLIGSSFTDLFSGPAWIDQDKTTLFEDRNMTALTFTPDVTWEKATFPDDGNFAALASDGTDTRCIGAWCLSEQGNALTLNGTSLPLPSEMQGKAVVHVSIGALTSRFVVGVVTRNEGAYEGWVYSFDPSAAARSGSVAFIKVFGEANTPFQSTYDGTLGFGGTDDDWLAVYGAYQGIAYHIQSGSPFTDVSRFFGIRVMNGGFQPVVTRVAAQGHVLWYVWSLTPNSPRFIKLYEDGSTGGAADIEGGFDLSSRLFTDTTISTASFRAGGTQGNAVVLQARTQGGDGTQTYVLSDNGFQAPATALAQSVNISNYPADVRSATIVDDDLFLGSSSAQFFLSNDGTNWVPATVGQEVAFPDQNGRQLFWRAAFTLGQDARSIPPYFDRIRVDYKVKFL